jgi:uncharacterized membrane protein YsdA (DUF1294 family)
MEIDTIAILALLYLGANLLAAAVFARDKRLAKRNSWRTSENALLLLALFGPFGAFFSMRMFHHKTQKLKFQLVSLFLVLHSALIIYLLVNLRL